MKKWNAWIFLAVGLIAGLLLGSNFFSGKEDTCRKDYKFINPRLACEERPIVSKGPYGNFESNLEGYLNVEIQSGRLFDASVYFRDLENGPVFGVNENKQFISASLIKLPTVITVLRLAEKDPQILNRQVRYAQAYPRSDQDIIPEKTLEVGQTYTVDDLIYRTLIYSDNAANELLIDEISKMTPGQDVFLNTFHDLGLLIPGDSIESDISTRAYSSMLRQLYHASFLSKEMSEKALSLLAESAFPEGLRAGLPNGIIVAEKFGERQIDYVEGGKVDRKINELHDCGIVYYPRNPYLLCVMTKGQDFGQLSKIIETISQKVYQEVDSRKINK